MEPRDEFRTAMQNYYAFKSILMSLMQTSGDWVLKASVEQQLSELETNVIDYGVCQLGVQDTRTWGRSG